MSDEAAETESAVESVMLAGTDGVLVSIAARLLMAMNGGQARMDAAERLIQHYRDDIGDAHQGVAAETLDEMAAIFGGALMLRMLRVAEDGDEVGWDTKTPRTPGALPPVRRRVMEDIGRFLKVLGPRH